MNEEIKRIRNELTLMNGVLMDIAKFLQVIAECCEKDQEKKVD